MVESFPILTILPPLVAIIMVIATRKVLASLASGVILSILLITNFHPVESLKLLFSSVLELFWADGAPNWYNILILAFLLELGAITAIVLMSGGTQAFSNWARLFWAWSSSSMTTSMPLLWAKFPAPFPINTKFHAQSWPISWTRVLHRRWYSFRFRAGGLRLLESWLQSSRPLR